MVCLGHRLTSPGEFCSVIFYVYQVTNTSTGKMTLYGSYFSTQLLSSYNIRLEFQPSINPFYDKTSLVIYRGIWFGLNTIFIFDKGVFKK